VDWATISSLATAGGTLVLAGATFSSVRSANRSARAAEEALRASVRPLLMPSRFEDPTVKVGFVDNHWVKVPGGRATIEITEEVVYLAVSLRNAGSGLAVLHGWRIVPDGESAPGGRRPEVDSFRRLGRDLYIPPGDVHFHQGALRDATDDDRVLVEKRHADGARHMIDILYGDQHGGQRVVSRFSLTPTPHGDFVAAVGRHWNVDRPDPR
jgi:hypothetical protein